MVSVRKWIAKKLDPEVYKELSMLTEMYKRLLKAFKEIPEQVTESPIQVDVPKETIDTACHESFRKIADISYENKRNFKDKSISLFLNQMITPRAFEVVRMRKSIPRKDDFMQYVRDLGDAVASRLYWTDDKYLNAETKDVYLYPEETIVYLKADCEDHAFLVSSLEPEIGVVYGYKTEKNGNKYGHAWNLFKYNQKLYILDTVNKVAEIYPFDTNGYESYFVITKDNTYQVRTGVVFGKIAKL
jgi:hypothetical protein